MKENNTPKEIRYSEQIKNLVKARLGQKVVEKIKLVCPCGKEFYRRITEVGERNYCSRECRQKNVGEFISKSTKGIKKMSEESKEKLRKFTGPKSSNWKGGRFRNKCKECDKAILPASIYCQNHKHKLWTKEKWEAALNGSRKKLVGKLPQNICRPGKFMNVKRGWFDINGINMFFRSKWEVNYALYLDFLVKQKEIIKWEYEKDCFVFKKIKFGTRSYRPDFKIYNNNGSCEYHEIKGWMTLKSKTQLKRMGKYYPEVKVVLINQEKYNNLKRQVGGLLHFF